MADPALSMPSNWIGTRHHPGTVVLTVHQDGIKLRQDPSAQDITPTSVLSLSVSLIQLLQLRANIEGAFFIFIRQSDSAPTLEVQSILGTREQQIRSKEEIIKRFTREKLEKIQAKQRLESDLPQIPTQIQQIRSALSTIGDNTVRQFLENEIQALFLTQSCVVSTQGLQHKINTLAPTILGTAKREPGKTAADIEEFENLRQASELVEFTSSISNLRSAISKHIVRLLKGLVGDFGSRSPTHGLNFEEDVTTFLRVFQNDNSTVDKLVKEHGLTLKSFCDNNVSNRPHNVHETTENTSAYRLRSLVRTEVDDKADRNFLLDSSRRNLDNAIDSVEREKREQVLKSLHHRQMVDREDDISAAYPTTFEWIFDEAASNGQWDDYKSFLIDKTIAKPFWANGKAGSGKSTLMKFIASHSETKSCLDMWAQGNEVIIISFFFWNLGGEMQKSTQGLLTSILYQALNHHPELMRIVLDDMWSNVSAGELELNPLSYAELKRAVDKLFRTPSRKFHVCLFIDGLDEFDGDFLEIAAFVKRLASNDIKVVASSRPIPECFEIFRDCPTLRLEYLTYNDVWTYVDGKLASHAYLQELMEDEPEEARGLVQDVTDSASGVFLWVRLVVQSLTQGLRNGDSLTDLQRRLKELPRDLEQLFEHMINRLEPLYQDQAIQYFELFREATKMTDRPLEALDLYYALAGPHECLKSNVLSIDTKSAIKKCEMIERRIRSRCCGLLELHQPVSSRFYTPASGKERKYAWETNELPAYRVQYLHRSVAEFLYQDHVWSSLCARKVIPSFDVHESLSHAFLAKIHRIGPRHQRVAPFAEILSVCLRIVFYCEQQYELKFGKAQIPLIHELTPYMAVAWQRDIMLYWTNAGDNFDRVKETWSASQYLFLLAARWGLTEFVKDAVDSRNLSQLWPIHVPHLWPILDSRLLDELMPTYEIQRDVVGILLDAGADPNAHFQGQAFVERLDYMIHGTKPSEALRLKDMLKMCQSKIACRTTNEHVPGAHALMPVKVGVNRAPLANKRGRGRNRLEIRHNTRSPRPNSEASFASAQDCFTGSSKTVSKPGSIARSATISLPAFRLRGLSVEQPGPGISTNTVSTGCMVANRGKAARQLYEVLARDTTRQSESALQQHFVDWALAGLDE